MVCTLIYGWYDFMNFNNDPFPADLISFPHLHMICPLFALSMQVSLGLGVKVEPKELRVQLIDIEMSFC